MSIVYEKENLPQACQITKNMTDHTGKKYNRLTFLYPCHDSKNRLKWICQCDCGNYVEVFAGNVIKENKSILGNKIRDFITPPLQNQKISKKDKDKKGKRKQNSEQETSNQN